MGTQGPPISIYALVDPRDARTYYVGKSLNPRDRRCDHEKRARWCTRATHGRCVWIAGLLARGLRPELVILERVAWRHWDEAERAWIEYGAWSGWPLTNLTPGGPGKYKKP